MTLAPHHKTFRIAAIALAAVVTGSVTAGDSQPGPTQILIDDFDQTSQLHPWPIAVDGAGVDVAFDTQMSEVLGGTRYSLLRSRGLLDEGDAITASIDTQLGVLNYDASENASGALSLNYGGIPDPLHADFSETNGIVIELNMLSMNTGELGHDQYAPMTVVALIDDNVWGAVGTRHVDAVGQTSLFFAYDDMDALGEIDLTDLHSIVIEFMPADGVSFSVDRIYAAAIGIPAPGAVALLGLAGIVGRRSRRRR